MRKMSKVISMAMASILVVGLAAGCGAPASKEGTGAKKVTLKTVSMFGGTDPNAVTYQAINEQFAKDHPNVTLADDSTTTSQEWKTKIAADFAAGNEPDVLQYFTDYNAKDVLAADKFVTVEEIKEKYPEYARDIKPEALKLASAPDGTSYAVPTTGYYEGMFCNKELFDKYNLELPTDWPKLLTAIETFKKNDIIPIAVSLNEVPHYWVEHLLLSAAGPDEYTTVPSKAPQSWVQGLDMFKTLRDMGAFPVDTDTIDNAFAQTLYEGEKAAMCLNGSWFANGLKDGMETKSVITAFPTIDGGKKDPTDVISGLSNGFYITKKAWEDEDKREAAVQYVMAHTNKESVVTYWGGAGIAAVDAEMPAEATEVVKSGYEMANKAKTVSAPTDARVAPEAFSTLIGSIVDVSTGKMSSEDAINQALAIHNK